MRRRSETGGRPVKAQRRKTLKRRKVAKAVSRQSSSAVGQGTKVALLTRERDEALERLTAARLERIADAANQSLILIPSDINMPGMSSIELLAKAKAIRPDMPTIMITTYGDAETKRKAWRAELRRC
jgi:CheY-like chemotaxis protein